MNTKAPVILALCQVTLTELPKAKEKFDDLHEILRHKGFPRAQRGSFQEVRIDAVGNQFKQETAEHPFLLVHSADNAWVAQIMESRIVLATKSYTGFEAFKEKLSIILEALEEVLTPTHYLSCGFRILDLITEVPGLKLKEMLIAGFLGPNVVEGLERVESVTATVFKTMEGTLQVKSWVKPQLLIAPDLQQVALWLNLTPPIPDTECILLDTDHFLNPTESVAEFAVENIMEKVEALKVGARKAFDQFTTEEASKAWGIKR